MPEGQVGPAPMVVLRPLAAAWFAQHPTVIQQLRKASIQQRSLGRLDLAEQLEEASEQLRWVREWRSFCPASANGSAEVAEAEVEPPLERHSLDTTEVAERLKRSKRWVRMLIENGVENGGLSATKVGGRWLVDRESVDLYELSRSTG